MKTYPLTSTLIGILSDDYLYFEGTARPQVLLSLRDEAPRIITKREALELERYFNDLYSLFLRKLTLLPSSTGLCEEDSVKLQALLQELIKVKSLIENVPKVDIMRG